MSYSKKRKRVVVTVGEKMAALERIDKGEAVLKIANELNVGENTVRDWKKNRQQLEKFSSQVDGSLMKRCTLKKPKLNDVDEALWDWFVKEQKKGIIVTGAMLKEKALILEAIMSNKGDFTASNGWLSRWKKRHGVYRERNPKDIKKEELDGSNGITEFFIKSENSSSNASDINKGSEEQCTSSTFGHIVGVKGNQRSNGLICNNTESVFSRTDFVSHRAGKAALSLALRYIKQQPEALFIDFLLIKKWLDYASMKIYNKLEIRSE